MYRMADDTDIREFVHERYRRTDEKLDKVLDGIAELRQMVSGIVQILASHGHHMLAMEVRLGRIEKRFDMHDPAIPS
jgi:membrane-anchored protein YejM (alkaline phosphatase superfamily)